MRKQRQYQWIRASAVKRINELGELGWRVTIGAQHDGIEYLLLERKVKT